jgi:hypothetical protein
MNRWTKESALQDLVSLGNEINSLARTSPFSSEHTRWVANVLRVLEGVFGRRSRYYLTFANFTWRFHGSTVVTVDELLYHGHPDDVMRSRDQRAFAQQLESAHGLLCAAIDDLQQAPEIGSVYEGKDTGPEASSILKVINITERKLRKVIHETPKNEKQVQDCFETLLVGADIPYSREKVSFQYSSRSYRPDFTLEQLDLAIEIKLCNTRDREKDIVQEMNDDLLAYKTRFGNILFVVYDLGCIRDVDRFAAEFETQENVVVRVIKN